MSIILHLAAGRRGEVTAHHAMIRHSGDETRHTHVSSGAESNFVHPSLATFISLSVCPLQSDRLAEYFIFYLPTINFRRLKLPQIELFAHSGGSRNAVLTASTPPTLSPNTHTPSTIDRELPPPPLHLPFFPSFLPSFRRPLRIYCPNGRADRLRDEIWRHSLTLSVGRAVGRFAVFVSGF